MGSSLRAFVAAYNAVNGDAIAAAADDVNTTQPRSRFSTCVKVGAVVLCARRERVSAAAQRWGGERASQTRTHTRAQRTALKRAP